MYYSSGDIIGYEYLAPLLVIAGQAKLMPAPMLIVAAAMLGYVYLPLLLCYYCHY